MVQKEVAKKTKTYGLVGILLAVILVATIYTYGTVPIASVLPSVNGMQTFASYDELKDFLNNTGSTSVYGTSYGDKYTITGDVTPT
jgi:cytochrome c oxidase assembly protein Cox11